MGEEFTLAIKEINAYSASALVLRGQGKAFSAGGDLKFLNERASDTPANNVREMRAFYARFLEIRKVTCPTIAAINGAAVGGKSMYFRYR